MSGRFAHVRFISAGAGSGKTYRLTEELENALVRDGRAPSGVIATTFTVKAAAELRERVRERLIRTGRIALAEQTAQSLIGTVHSVCERLLARFAFELGLSPELRVASLEDCTDFFNEALDDALAPDPDAVRTMNGVAYRLGIDDWRGDVKQIADRARENDIAPDALVAMGRRCADELLAHFPPPVSGDWDAWLVETVSRALDAIDLEHDTTVGTRKYHDGLKAAIYRLRRPPVPWPLWISLANRGATKKSDDIAATVREAAAVYEKHPRFQADVRTYLERGYAIAAAALERFQSIKKERGLIDFGDMEQELLRALDLPEIRARLDDELELLLVDEFQDTNPMQLAIFMKLATLADEVVFVGDVKQAIYGFRGCDPELVRDTLDALIARGGRADVLEHSWRSRPPLVEYVNQVFVQAFDGELEAAQVKLAAKRTDATREPAVLRWTIDGRGGERVDAIARGVADLVRTGYRIEDPETGETRPLRWGDVAVLAASNDNVEAIAKALRAAHVPMKMTLSGLLAVPEICLAKAALRRLNDPTDTLATAEIVAMSDCVEPETWLADRLRRVAAGEDGYAWAEDTHPIVAKLAALREKTGTQSPVEIVARVLNSVGLREVVTAWGPSAIKAAQRQKNLDALLNLAVQYERHCDAQHLAATLTGFLFWLEHPRSPELDLQPVVTTGDAVHVLTYHRAKGLEWPVVVAADLHYCWPPGLWDVRIERGDAPFDPERPLEDRFVRYWPRIFGPRTNGVPILDAIRDSAEGRACLEKDERENRRLAYVGLTRARDALVLATPARDPSAEAWLHAFGGPSVLPEGDALVLGAGRTIATRATVVGGDIEGAAPEPFAPRRLPERAPLAERRRERVLPSQAAEVAGAAAVETVELGARIRLFGDDMTAIGTGLHAVIAAELINPGRPDAVERARALLEGFGVAAFVGADDAVAAARRLRAFVDRLGARQVLVECPIVHRLDDGCVVRGAIDVLVETDAGWIVIDHKSSPRPRVEWPTEAAGHSGQLAAYRSALEAAGRKVASCWIHFPVGGGIVRVALPG
ncbi:MAG TPA: UvrD-helicase domain-containing protein [Gammaproteobacteria bacterium]